MITFIFYTLPMLYCVFILGRELITEIKEGEADVYSYIVFAASFVPGVNIWIALLILTDSK